ncbi:hypothetical protein FJ366_00215 [Candidatus Dependentiae bacterium]|nr:hypothetical protein [Candidatus Dependentiae bacterium]
MRVYLVLLWVGLIFLSGDSGAYFSRKPFYTSSHALPSPSHLAMEDLLNKVFNNKPTAKPFNFSSPYSTMNLNAGSKLFLNSGVFEVVGGTVTQEEGATVYGEIRVTEDGRYVHESGTTAVGLYGNFTQLTSGEFVLGGNTRMSATFGPISGAVLVRNQNNRIEGNAYFQQSVTLENSSAVLTLAVGTVISKPIYLNGGTLILDSDLSFGYEGYLVGPGTVDGQGAGSLRFSGTADQWNTGLTFKNVHTLELSGSTKLTGTWNFEGETNIIGGGCLLDTRALGILNLRTGAVVKMNGVKIGNMKQNTLSLTPTSTAFFSDSTLSLAETITLTSGTWYVNSDSVFSIKENELFVSTQGRLMVDACTLWLDSSDTTGLTLFQGNDSLFVKKYNQGLLRVMTDMDKVTSGASRRLLNGDVLDDIVLTENLSLRTNQFITYGGSAVLDGSGTSILFARGSVGQLNVPSGVTLTIRNLNLMRITNGVLNVPTGARLNISNDVLIELDQNTTLSTGIFTMIGRTDILRIRGNGGRKKLILAPADEGFQFNIRSNTLMLEDVELIGIEHIQYSFTTDAYDNRIVGVVGLDGVSVIDITRDTNMSLMVNGRDSGLVLLNNNLTLSGSVLFGLAPENILNIMFALQTGSDLPRVTLGDGFCTLTSVGGNAGINFINDQVTLDLLKDKSIIAGERSFISGKNIIVTTSPIRVASTQFSIRQGTDLSSSGIENPIDVITSRSPSLFSDLMGDLWTAYHLKEFENIREKAERDYSAYLDETVFTRSLETRRRISVPAPTVRVMGRLALSRAVGAVALTGGGSVHRFLPDNWIPFSASLTGGSKLEQNRVRPYTPIPLRDPASLQTPSQGTFAGLKETDVLYVTKGQNIMTINSNFNILGDLEIDEDAELIFDLANGAILTFGHYNEGFIPRWGTGTPQGYDLRLPKNSTLRFRGNGTVRFSDGSQIIFEGSTFVETISIENPRNYDDNRPELVISDFALLDVSDHHRLVIKGRGKVNIATNGSLNVGDGLLTIGMTDADFFDFKVFRAGSIGVSVPRQKIADAYSMEARCSFNHGFFNLNFSDKGTLKIGDRGVVELGLNYNESTRGFINEFYFKSQAVLDISEGGALVFGQNYYAPAGLDNLILPMKWDNQAGEIYGGGLVRAVDGSVSGGRTLFQAVLQRAFFATSESSGYQIVRNLSKYTSLLRRAIDYYLPDGNYYLEFPSGTRVSLNFGDIIRAEDPTTGVVSGVFGTSQFNITPGGLRTTS